LVPSTISKYELLFRQLHGFSKDKGIRYLTELDLGTLREFCGTWTQGDNTVSKEAGAAAFVLPVQFGVGLDRQKSHNEDKRPQGEAKPHDAIQPG
jgi:hypothetical protein